MLDCFTCTGGFALHASKLNSGGAEFVEAIDSSAPALATAEANARANGIANVQFRQADVFEFLAGIEGKYAMVVLDPPPFAKSRPALAGAARGYKEINLRALRLLDAGKTLRVLERRTQAADHPILLTVPETHYLKCLILEVL